MRSIFKPWRLPMGASVGLLVLRLVAGLAFMFHGFGKIQKPFGWMGPESNIPSFLQGLAAISEFGGGLAWILGFLTPVACLGLCCTMAVAAWMHAFVFHDPFVAQGPGQGAFEPASVYFCIALLLLLGGPGRFSLDRLLFGERASEARLPETNKPEG